MNKRKSKSGSGMLEMEKATNPLIEVFFVGFFYSLDWLPLFVSEGKIIQRRNPNSQQPPVPSTGG